MLCLLLPGTQIYQEIPLLEMPTAVEVFMLHDNEAAVAVSAATYIYIYKGLRPYYKFALPILDVRRCPLTIIIKFS